MRRLKDVLVLSFIIWIVAAGLLQAQGIAWKRKVDAYYDGSKMGVYLGGTEYTKPVFADLDHDGDGDLYVGEHDGYLNVFINEGGYPPNFSCLTTALDSFDVGKHCAPHFWDIDLDGDLDPDTEYPATLQYVGQVFNELAAVLTSSDQLFIFTTDHGGQESGYDCYLNLWNLEELRDDQMAAYIAALPCETVICTFEQCFSGGMVDDLQGDGRVIATAANWNEYSWAMPPNYIYDEFVYYWTSAVAGEDPYGVPVDADTNDDGLVSMHEAFIYAADASRKLTDLDRAETLYRCALKGTLSDAQRRR
ncbi:C13 family peptidase, partial [bacterium]|nr:C13 family peptidase [bacterium]